MWASGLGVIKAAPSPDARAGASERASLGGLREGVNMSPRLYLAGEREDQQVLQRVTVQDAAELASVQHPARTKEACSQVD